jgi:hypothetical protein
MLKVLSIAVVEPIEEVLVCLCLLPLLVVCAQITAVAVLLIDHFEKILEVHHLGRLLALGPFLDPLLPVLGAPLGRLVVVCLGRTFRVVSARSSRDLADPLPFLTCCLGIRSVALFGCGQSIAQCGLLRARLGLGCGAPFRFEA